MERTVPSTASEEIELYQRTYYSLLRTTAEVQIRTLEEAHGRMKSLLHRRARDPLPDMSAFVYSILRLPECMDKVQLVVLGQGPKVFEQRGFVDVESWERVSAQARRRQCFFNGEDTLACYIASRSDIDDVIPILTAYQIEWNKFHSLLHLLPNKHILPEAANEKEGLERIAGALHISREEIEQLRLIWGERFWSTLQVIARRPSRLRVRLLSGSMVEYWRATRIWWENIETMFPEIEDRPVYFISSNPHSVVNLLSGFVREKRKELLDYLDEADNADLRAEWEKIEEARVPSNRDNFFYYVFKKYQRTPRGPALEKEMIAYERALGIQRIPSQRSFDVEAQVIEINRLRPEFLDPRLETDGAVIQASDAVILNIDYPLGLAAYNILSKVAEHVGEVRGVYVTGKAATLNGVIGDVMIPNVVHDEQSRNTYLFPNAFSAADVSPFIVYGAVLDNQKAVSVRGTFLQNEKYMDVFYREGYTDIEMEAGPYLSAVYEMMRPQRHPIDEVVNLYGISFDLGILHYASDTPLSKGKNLGAGSLSYFGMDSTYAACLAILRRIFELERNRIRSSEARAGNNS